MENDAAEAQIALSNWKPSITLNSKWTDYANLATYGWTQYPQEEAVLGDTLDGVFTSAGLKLDKNEFVNPVQGTEVTVDGVTYKVSLVILRTGPLMLRNKRRLTCSKIPRRLEGEAPASIMLRDV